MDRIYIICIEDQREVLESIISDLESLEPQFEIEACETAAEAHELLDELDGEGNFVGLIVSDHVMPGQTGVEFLIELHKDSRFRNTKKLLLTGLATHQDTINAINNAAIDRFIEKPWSKQILIQYAKTLLTEFIFEKGISYEKYLPQLDQLVMFERLKRNS